MREIEIKARVANKQTLLSDIAKAGITLKPAVEHHDVVFCRPGQKDYEPDSIWLRIRTEDDSKVVWTLKKDTGRRLDSIEHEVEVSDANELETMLRLMGLELYSDLTKTRQKAYHDGVEICVDTVDGLGTFVEVEKLAKHDSDGDAIREDLWRFLEKLGINKQDEETRGYDVLLKTKG